MQYTKRQPHARGIQMLILIYIPTISSTFSPDNPCVGLIPMWMHTCLKIWYHVFHPELYWYFALRLGFRQLQRENWQKNWGVWVISDRSLEGCPWIKRNTDALKVSPPYKNLDFNCARLLDYAMRNMNMQRTPRNWLFLYFFFFEGRQFDR